MSVEEGKREVDNVVEMFRNATACCTCDDEYFYWYNELGIMLTDIHEKYNNYFVDQYISIIIDFLFAENNICG